MADNYGGQCLPSFETLLCHSKGMLGSTNQKIKQLQCESLVSLSMKLWVNRTLIELYPKIKVSDKLTAFFPKKFICLSQPVDAHGRAGRKDFHSGHSQDVELKHGKGRGLWSCATSLENTHLNTHHQGKNFYKSF